MKKTLFTALFSLTAFWAMGQNFSASLIGGISIAQIDGDKLKGYNKPGLVAGGATQYKLDDEWAVQQEIVYYQRGSRATDNQLTLDNFSVKRLEYIDLSLLAVYQPLDQDWSIIGGLGYGAFINVKSDVTEKKSLYKADKFGEIGAQYQLSDQWKAVLKMQYSLVSMFKTQNANNNSISLTLHYQLF